MVVRLHSLQQAVFEATDPPAPGRYHGLRATADEFFALPEDGARYELIDGVIVMSPSPTPSHQAVAGEIHRQLANHVAATRRGRVLYETDVVLSFDDGARRLVYRPEIIYFSEGRRHLIRDRVRGAPDLVVEVISESSRALDTGTKRVDYERAGVREYWIVDPAEDRFTFYRLTEGRFVSVPLEGERWRSEVAAGFELDVTRVRAAFERF